MKGFNKRAAPEDRCKICGHHHLRHNDGGYCQVRYKYSFCQCDSTTSCVPFVVEQQAESAARRAAR